MGFFAIVVALVAGAANPFQSATNGALNKELGEPIWAGIIVYATGLLGMLLIQAFSRHALPLGKASGVSWWAWTGGLISILSTIAGLTLVRKLGAGIFTSLSLTASLIVSVLLDQFGLLGLRQHPTSPGRVLGCGLLIVGVWLVSRS